MVDQHGLRPDHVANGDDGELERVRPAMRSGGGRAGRAKAAAEHVGADDEEALGVDGSAGPDHRLPPAGLVGHGILVCDVLVAGERMADQDGVGAVRIERAIGLVGDAERRQRHAAVQAQRLVGGKAHDPARRCVRLVDARWAGRPARLHRSALSPVRSEYGTKVLAEHKRGGKGRTARRRSTVAIGRAPVAVYPSFRLVIRLHWPGAQALSAPFCSDCHP